MTTEMSDIGLVGLAVMGQNLALNIESRGWSVRVFNRTPAATAGFVARHPGLRLHPADTLESLVAGLSRPRRIILMVQAGAAVDAVLDALLPLLERGDIVIDGGNSLYTDTERRDARLAAAGLSFVGCGISGGEEGARKGPSIMPGGDAAAWTQLQPVLEAIAARAGGAPCVMHIGPGGAGHFVKMVHNGIEYGDMQLIAEAYHLLRASGMPAGDIAEVFERWNGGELQSYLVQITALALKQVDPASGRPLVDMIVDRAGQKGTGRWTVIAAAQQAVAAGTIAAAVDARILSALKPLRLQAAGALGGPDGSFWARRDVVVSQVHEALYAAKIISYAQGFDLMRSMGRERGWGLDLAGIAAIWRGGCIIRARFLDRITDAYRRDPDLPHLALDPFFAEVLNRAQSTWRQLVALAVSAGVPVPAFGASLAYYDSLRSAQLPANLLQAQRDFFGAHTYERVDRPAGEFFHTEWPEVIE